MPVLDVGSLYQIQHYHSLHLHEAENVLSSLVLIALLTYFYTAFGKLFQPGGMGRDEISNDYGGKQGSQEARQKLRSPIYYSSPAAA